MDTLMIQSALPELGVRASRSAPVIIATDGRAQSDSALVVGRMLAGSPDAFRLVTVIKPMPVLPEVQMPVTSELDASRRDGTRRETIAQMTRMWHDEYDVEVADGDPATVVARLAHQAGARMIVAGLGRHRVSDRVFGDETALRLIRMADVPIFAVANGLDHAPRRIVVAVDFSETSLRAARLALEVASPAATIYLVHVSPRDSTLYDWKEWGTNYKADAGDALQKTREQLRVPKDTSVQNVLLQGDTATELLAFATSVNADLIATGSHGRGFVARLLIGSVTTRIVRCSTCSVLTVPHSAMMTRMRTTVEPPVVLPLASVEWAARLNDFTKRNIERRGVLEVDDVEIGAQAQEFDYPFLGATYDVHDERVELMFGGPGRADHHLTRGIANVTSIDVLRDEAGRDLAIRIAHGTGQTLLTFTTTDLIPPLTCKK
jgi:nucleotide-binding universal stress UspA family protein